MRSRKILYNKTAFSLIELMISGIIIGVLVAITVPSYMNYRLRAEEQKATSALYAYAQAQKAFWFEQDPNTYANMHSDLSPSYVDMPADDGDWHYSVTGDATSFTILAQHLDRFGAMGDGISLSLDEQGHITRVGFAYTLLEAP